MVVDRDMLPSDSNILLCIEEREGEEGEEEVEIEKGDEEVEVEAEVEHS